MNALTVECSSCGRIKGHRCEICLCSMSDQELGVVIEMATIAADLGHTTMGKRAADAAEELEKRTNLSPDSDS